MKVMGVVFGVAMFGVLGLAQAQQPASPTGRQVAPTLAPVSWGCKGPSKSSFEIVLKKFNQYGPKSPGYDYQGKLVAYHNDFHFDESGRYLWRSWDSEEQQVRRGFPPIPKGEQRLDRHLRIELVRTDEGDELRIVSLQHMRRQVTIEGDRPGTTTVLNGAIVPGFEARFSERTLTSVNQGFEVDIGGKKYRCDPGPANASFPALRTPAESIALIGAGPGAAAAASGANVAGP